ncbi:hypothetical protein RHGRI_034113 [Rhododendron griersonianum]|uniref:Uncharacterized protein n=1 Tax=Rhododendron griersonianum TaxID=479676 RepID=A0AAV6HZ87_9ERIC|nr:hypothetical protein RHGRI_034113 [Rhododendron griersonianum]
MERDYSSGATLSDEIPAVLRSDPQVREYLCTPSPSRDRNRSPSPQRPEGKNAHVKGHLGKRVAPYDERILSLSPDWSQARDDFRDHLARSKENHRLEVSEESSGSFYDLAYTASHETAVDRQRERQYRGQEECARRHDRDRYYRREQSPSPGHRERRHREEVYERHPALAADPSVAVTPKAPQTKVKMDFYLHPPKDMDDLMLRIDQHCLMSEDMATRWKVTGGFGKAELGKGGKGRFKNIQKGKGKDRWVEEGGGGYQMEYIRGPKPHKFEAGPIVFKDPLHELLKNIEHEPYFSYPTDDIPCPKPKDKYRCSYHAKWGHLVPTV